MRMYVIGCYVDENQNVLVIHKERPAWQAGRINLPGGKMEAVDVDPIAAIVREMEEETGWYAIRTDCELVGEIHDNDSCIYVVRINSLYGPGRRRSVETENIELLPWRELQIDPRLIPNLRLVIPLVQSEVRGWKIQDDMPSAGQSDHSFQVVVPTYLPSSSDGAN